MVISIERHGQEAVEVIFQVFLNGVGKEANVRQSLVHTPHLAIGPGVRSYLLAGCVSGGALRTSSG